MFVLKAFHLGSSCIGITYVLKVELLINRIIQSSVHNTTSVTVGTCLKDNSTEKKSIIR